jgi:hypothetical protein
MAAENSNVPLRRSERKTLNTINKSAHSRERDNTGSTFSVRDSADSRRLKLRISMPWEKSFILVCSTVCFVLKVGPDPIAIVLIKLQKDT